MQTHWCCPDDEHAWRSRGSSRWTRSRMWSFPTRSVCLGARLLCSTCVRISSQTLWTVSLCLRQCHREGETKKQKLQQLSQPVNKIDCRKQTLVWTLIFLFSSRMKVLMFNRSSYKCASEAGYPEYISRRLLTSLARSCLSFLLLCASCDPPLTM